jgi:hypothetical protein
LAAITPVAPPWELLLFPGESESHHERGDGSKARRVLGMGEDRCFDDWRLAVERGTKASKTGVTQAQEVFHIVSLRASSRAHRVTRRAPDATVHLVDSQGRAYDPSSVRQNAHEVQNGAAKPFGEVLSPGSSFTTARVSDLPMDAKEVGPVVVHGFWPGWFIIGDSQSLLHKRITIKLMWPTTWSASEPATRGILQWC